MSFNKKGRALGFALAVVVASLVFSASALGAKPKGLQIEVVEPGVNFVKVKGTANPNGASTTLIFENWNSETLKWVELSSTSLGSGTSPVSKEYTYTNLGLGTEYFFRVSAKNSSGTSTSGEATYYPEWWAIEGYSGPHEATISSSGTLRFEWTQASHKAKIECAESNGGAINASASNVYHIAAEGCGYYLDGTRQCSTPNLFFPVDNSWEATEFAIGWQPCSHPAEQELGPIRFQEPLRVSASGSGKTVPVKLTANVTVTGLSGVFTIESNWNLAGPEIGKTFSFASEY